MGLAAPEEKKEATFAPTGRATLTAARALASQIEGMNLPEVVTANAVKAKGRLDDGSERWMVWLVYTSDSVPTEITSLPNARRVDWEEKKSSNEDVGRAFFRLGVVSAIMWTGLAVAGGTALWWLLSERNGSSSSQE